VNILLEKGVMMKAYIVVDGSGKPLGYPISWGSAAAFRAKHGKPTDDIVRINAEVLTVCDEEDKDEPVMSMMQQFLTVFGDIIKFKRG
jgi:hypothetical protein